MDRDQGHSYMDMTTITVDGRKLEVKQGAILLDELLDAGIYVPYLCHHPDLPPTGECGLCIVKIDGMDDYQTSCTLIRIEEGMVITTKTEEIERLRKEAFTKMLLGHPADCTNCPKYLNCELQSLKQYLGIPEDMAVTGRLRAFPINTENPLFVHDPTRCVLCKRCLRACKDLRGVDVLHVIEEAEGTRIGIPDDKTLIEAGCRFCGACVEVCPTGAMRDKEELMEGKKRREALIPCKYTCPAEIDVPRYIRFIREKNYSAATAVVREKAPFPKILGYVCNHPCESVCRRREVNEAISIRDLKRFAAENDKDRLWAKNTSKEQPTDKRVAVVGSGPAGLTAAYYLAKLGHDVTVFEALPLAGGMMRVGIPEYRLPREVLDKEIQEIKDMGIEIRTNTKIDSLDKLFEEGYNALVVAVGTHEGQKLPVPGADHDDVLIGVDFLRDVNLGKEVKVREKVLVLGGGYVAFDCARAACRLGAHEVRMACLESRDTMPASPDEVKQGEEEGVAIHPSRTLSKIVSENGHITGVECLEVESFEFDEEGRALIDVREGSEHMLPADTIIFAIGQRPEIPDQFELDRDERGNIEVDPYTSDTSREGVFAAGDAVTGTASVIEAIASGRSEAAAADRYLGGSGMIDEELAPITVPETWLGCDENFAYQHRRENTCMPAEERLNSFCEIVYPLDEESTLAESKRCLQCDLRFKITPIKFWGEY